jgi:hypothetical protein
MAEQSKAEHNAWMNGWTAGHAMKVALGQSNPLIGTDENLLFHAKLSLDN